MAAVIHPAHAAAAHPGSSGVALPRPGPRWGPAPERPDGNPLTRARPAATWQGGWALAAPVISPLLPWWPGRWVLASHRAWLAEVRREADRHGAGPSLDAWAAALRPALHREGLSAARLTQALALALAVIREASGQTLHDTQLLAARWMLDEHFVEMATGEGKTWAMAATALVAALAGVPVHVVTANDYLAERDARALQAIGQRLGLRIAHIDPTLDAAGRQAVYAHDIVFATARELAFDHLRDRLGARQQASHRASGNAAPLSTGLMRGLCWALLDEADSILLDEAGIPLVISLPTEQGPDAKAQQHTRRALWWQALQLARSLQPDRDLVLDAATRRAHLTPEGQARVAERAAPLGGLWRRERLRTDLIGTALVALHLLQRDRDYLVRDGQIELLDGITGRAAPGRVWSAGLQAAVSIKEQCTPGAPTDTVAQITFQRFFRRYWRLAGLSGTLAEARGELHGLTGLDLVRLPSRQASRRQDEPTRFFEHPGERWQAVADRIRHLTAQGRPVLVGTDAVSDADALSAVLHQAGIAHTVLHARHDDQEADIVARAGQAARVTVATRMAGRGTDIQLDERARAAGGLHVINCQRNASRRHDRQLAGRCARQGEPGSAEAWICASNLTDRAPSASHKLTGWKSRWLAWRFRLSQWIDERRQAAWRQQLLEQDQLWEQQHRLARRSAGNASGSA